MPPRTLPLPSTSQSGEHHNIHTMAKDSNMSFDAEYPTPKDVKDTKMLQPGAREPESFQVGSNDITRDVRKHGPFGGLGGRGFADNSGDS